MSKFEYFIECYLIQCFDFDNLSEMISEFLDEKPETINKVKDELHAIITNASWQYAIELIKSRSGYCFDEGAVQEFLNDILTYLNENS